MAEEGERAKKKTPKENCAYESMSAIYVCERRPRDRGEMESEMNLIDGAYSEAPGARRGGAAPVQKASTHRPS